MIRGALVQAALDDEGLTLINFLNKLSTNVQIDLKKAIRLARQVELVVDGTYLFIEKVTELAAKEAEKTKDTASLEALFK